MLYILYTIYLYLFLCVTYIVYGCSHRTQKHHPFGFARRPQTAERQPRPWDLVHHSEIEGFNRFLFARIAKYIQISFFLIYQLMAFVINFDALHTKWWSLVKIIAFRRRGDMLWSQLEKHWQTEHQMSRVSLVQNDCSLIDSRISPRGFEWLDTFGLRL